MNRFQRTLATTFLLLLSSRAIAGPVLLNASYDVARGFYREFNLAFAAEWQTRTQQRVNIEQSHGGSSKQARAVIDGLQADVVTMNNPLDIDAIADRGLIAKDWAQRLPNHASPSWSPILFVVRKNNPKQIRDWDDLVKRGVSVVIPNPKTSGNGRYSYLAAWEFALRKNAGDPAKARNFLSALFRNVPVLDTGGRGATTTFVQRGIGDVLLTFENEIHLIRTEFGNAQFETIVPSLTVRADSPISMVDRYASKHDTTALARAYLEYHYSAAAQDLIARNGLRPIDEMTLSRHADRFPAVNAFRVEQVFGSWAAVQEQHFSNGALFDQIYSRR